MKNFNAREGDFIETVDGLIFDVKGLVHPPDKIIAYMRYMEDPKGDRRRNHKIYKKFYSLNERDRIIKSKFPQYFFFDGIFGEYLEEVPKKFVTKLYLPIEKVSELLTTSYLDKTETDCIDFIKLLHDSANINFNKIGLSGSVLVKLNKKNSDIDIIIYGRKNCISAYESLKSLINEKNGSLRSYNEKDLKKLFEFRSKDTFLSYEEFILQERKKSLQGKFKKRDFFIRFLLDWNEVKEKYGDRIYSSFGYVKIKAKIRDASDSIFTPCTYVLSHVHILDNNGKKINNIHNITSFRGRFCEQAVEGDTIIAQGKLEKVTDKRGEEFFRLIIGAKPSDFMKKEV